LGGKKKSMCPTLGRGGANKKAKGGEKSRDIISRGKKNSGFGT